MARGTIPLSLLEKAPEGAHVIKVPPLICVVDENNYTCGCPTVLIIARSGRFKNITAECGRCRTLNMVARRRRPNVR